MQYLQGGGGPSYDLPRSWRYQKELTGTGALGDLGCHALDLVSFVTGKNYRKAVGHTDTYVTQRRLEEGEGYGLVDVDDFCHYLMEMDGKTSANFSVTRFAYGRGNYQRMEIYGSKGGLVYSLDVTPGVDELEVCFGYPYDRSGIYTKLPIPQRGFTAARMPDHADERALFYGKVHVFHRRFFKRRADAVGICEIFGFQNCHRFSSFPLPGAGPFGSCPAQKTKSLLYSYPNFKYSAIAFTHSSSSSGVPEMLHPAAFKR